MTRVINVFLFVLVASLSVNATPIDSVRSSHEPDTLVVRSRSFDQQLISEFQKNPDFRYGRPQTGLSAFDRFLIWLFSWIARFLSFATDTIFGRIFFYGLCAALIVYVILKLLNVDVRDLFFRGGRSSSVDFRIAEENIHGLDFEQLINDAVSKKQFRNAVRLVFLFSLKRLADAQLIQWMPGKTNDEYLAELAQHPSRHSLRELRYYFDYVWYGHFEVTDQTFAVVNETFRKFNATLP
jgi:hypothetical protein